MYFLFDVQEKSGYKIGQKHTESTFFIAHKLYTYNVLFYLYTSHKRRNFGEKIKCLIKKLYNHEDT